MINVDDWAFFSIIHWYRSSLGKKWEGPEPTETCGLKVVITMIADKPPQQAATGTMAPPSALTSTAQGPYGYAIDASQVDAAAGAAGT